MSKGQSLEHILDQAKEKEKEYDWPAAAEFYEKALRVAMKAEDSSRAGEVQEWIGYCFYRAAFQAETQEGFRNLMLMAARAYEKAAELFESIEKQAEASRCRAMKVYVNSRLATDLSERREQLEECWKSGKEALKVFEEGKDYLNSGKTCNDLMACLGDRLEIEWEAISREKIVEEALNYGERAIEIFSRAGDKHQLAQAYNLTAHFYKNAAFAEVFKVERREECRKKALSYPKKAIELSEEIGDTYLTGLSNFHLVDAHLDILGSMGLQERQYFQEMLRCGNLTKDNLLIAHGLWGLEFATAFSAATQDDPDKAREEYKRLDEYREKAIAHYNIIAQNYWIANAYAFGVVLRSRLAIETDLKSKRRLSEDMANLGYKGLEHARLSGSMGPVHFNRVKLGHALGYLARFETDTSRKRALLEESSKYLEESITFMKQASACACIEPRQSNLGNCIWSLARNEVELAGTEKTIDKRIKMLQKAISNMRSAREHWLEWFKSPWYHIEKPRWFIWGDQMMVMGKTLSRLYELTNDINILGDAIEAFEESIESYGKADSPFSRVAESHWQLAKVYDRKGNYIESARNFELASESYILAGRKIPQLKDFYKEHASYMEAWIEIEKARYHHAVGQYGLAKEHYEKAADLHKSTEHWGYLSQNYLAWARLEEAEDLSRREKTEEAKNLFQQAAELFVEARKSIKAKLEKIDTGDEKQMAAELVKVLDIRRDYCLGRVALEDAKILDRQGDHAASSGKYGSASERFQKAIDAMQQTSDRQELRPIVDLSRAWQMMTKAEAEASPELYLEASRLFDEAKEHSLDENAKLLALGHSCFCKALEAGTKFETTRDVTLYSTAKKFLEAATSHYVKAGFKNASQYARATHRLFDAYMYMHKAETEIEPMKKTQYYRMSEKLLQASAGSYMKAKHPEKSEEVQRLRRSVKEEQQLAVSLTEVLHAPTITSTTASFSTPAPTHEEAVGLERFEHADIQANLLLRVKQANVDEDMEFRMELVNAGKAPALLIKVDEITPEGFEIKEVPEICVVEDSYLNLKGRRLNPLKTLDIKMTIKPRSKGTFSIKPRVLYIDETGKYKTHEPEPVTITVKELGIKGWLEGPT